MALVFLGGGTLLTALSFQETRNTQQVEKNNERQAAGPLVVFIGLLMLAIGLLLSAINSSRRSTQGSSTLLAKPQDEGDQGFFSISSSTTTAEKINSSLESRCAKLDLAAPIVETVGGGRPHNFLSVTRLTDRAEVEARDIACFPD